MMRKDNPPAFPLLYGERDLGHNEGMLLRDYFAGHVLPSVAVLCRSDSGAHTDYPAYCAKRAYEFADAMLAARQSGDPS